MRSWIGFWMLFFTCCACPALAGQPAAVKGGNAALMEAWKARQEELSKKIAQHLFDSGQAPRNGTVSYTARVKPDASAPGGLELRVDSLTVTPGPGSGGVRVEGQAASQAMDMALGPRDPNIAVHLQNLDVPVGTEVSGAMTIRDGKPVEAQPAPAPPPPAEPPSLWQQLRNALGF